MQLSTTIKGSICVIGAFLIHFTLGSIFTFGNMTPYIVSYFRLRTPNVWITSGDTVWIVSTDFFCIGTFMALGGLLEKRMGARLTSLLGCWIMSISVSVTYFTIKMNLWYVVLTYGVCVGTGTGISYSVALAEAMKWFPLKPGTVLGIVVGGFGLGSFLFNLVQTSYINRANVSPRFQNLSNTGFDQEKYFFDNRVLDNIPRCFLVLGGIYASLQLLGVIMLMKYTASLYSDGIEVYYAKESIKDEKKPLLNEDTASSTIKQDTEPLKEADETTAINDYSLLQALGDRIFWLLWVTSFLNGIVILIITVRYKTFGQQFIDSDYYFCVLGSAGAISNCIGRVIWGLLFDLLKYRITMSVLTIFMVVMMGTFYFCSFIPNPLATKIVYFIWVCLLFVAHGGSFSLIPSVTVECFGMTNFAAIYGLIYTALNRLLNGKDVVEKIKTLLKSPNISETTHEMNQFTVFDAMKHKMFWLLWMTFILNGNVVVTITARYKTFGQTFIDNDYFLTILGSIGAVASCLGRVFWGRLFDMFQYRITMSGLTAFMTIAIGTFYLCSLITNSIAAKTIYFIWVLCLFLVHGGSFAVIPSATLKCFGITNLAIIYGLIHSGVTIASILGGVISSYLFPIIQYKGQFVLCTVSAILSLILTQFFRLPEKNPRID